ncbi:uncharacterized protein SPAPADRAFT_65675 [Spathaspora passalidarum NRRL Y-27907]|uniref:Transmembrane protein n=1 Tax=Spathaspora passalidarum (strain NRRL Y-27907 / 11-Y1) TaxID=619300 RepID=G3AJ37_SPAPN|nr:uncharacterized protein SPAPADRAFT_65675 [Spathaspora passalidarum NRRL Y-27907]EGW34549.1 hypothetical protein SPAPADRAFT_65675 [Spathaspora passalidarum NRRL Y-27907]
MCLFSSMSIKIVAKTKKNFPATLLFNKMDNQDLEKSPKTSTEFTNDPPPALPQSHLPLLNYTFIENISSLLIIISSIVYFSGNYSIFKFKVNVNSSYSQNIISIVQEGLKFITYLSNDLNVYVDETISDSNLQQIDSCYDNNLYQFNIWGFCRYDQFGGVVNCYKGQGLNMIACFIQDFGMQLGNLTNQPDPQAVSSRFVDVYYKSIQQLCVDTPTKLQDYQSQICKLQAYNIGGLFVQQVAVFHYGCLVVLFILGVAEQVFVSKYGFHRLRLNTRLAAKIVWLFLCFMSAHLIYIINSTMQLPIGYLLQNYPVGILYFEDWKFVLWNVIFLVNTVIGIYVGAKKRKIERDYL